MTMTTTVAQARLTRELHEAETALNEALLKQSQLFISMIAARRDVAVGQFAGQDALMRLNKSQLELISSGGNLARVHGRLVEVGREVGVLGGECPDDWRAIGQADELFAA